jgi:F1F0 ATPase subunit 2
MINILYFGFGAILGLVFFGGLKLTLQKSAEVKHPALLVMLSYLLRMAVLFGGLASLTAYAGLPALLWGTLGMSIVMLTLILSSRREDTA